jgi:hypothetical protein
MSEPFTIRDMFIVHLCNFKNAAFRSLMICETFFPPVLVIQEYDLFLCILSLNFKTESRCVLLLHYNSIFSPK